MALLHHRTIVIRNLCFSKTQSRTLPIYAKIMGLKQNLLLPTPLLTKVLAIRRRRRVSYKRSNSTTSIWISRVICVHLTSRPCRLRSNVAHSSILNVNSLLRTRRTKIGPRTGAKSRISIAINLSDFYNYQTRAHGVLGFWGFGVFQPWDLRLSLYTTKSEKFWFFEPS